MASAICFNNYTVMHEMCTLKFSHLDDMMHVRSLLVDVATTIWTNYLYPIKKVPTLIPTIYQATTVHEGTE